MSSSVTENTGREMSRGAFWLLLRRIAVFAGCIDLVYLVVFFVLGMPVIAMLNIVSASAYAVAYFLLGRRKNLPAVLLMWTEVLVHAGTCTILLGWETGIHYFLLVFLPAVAVSRSLRHAVLAMGFVLLSYIGLDVATQLIPVSYPLPDGMATVFRWLNLGLVFVMFGYTGRYYVERVEEAERRLHDLATTDTLSGLWNRRHFLDRARAEVRRAQRHGQSLVVVLTDIDHFKRVNDGHGHAAGDAVIRHVSDTLRAHMRAPDIVGRWGGEEFIMLLPQTDLNGAAMLCERLRRAIETTPCDGPQGAIPVTMSFGVAGVELESALEESVKHADTALYEAKHAGRNRVVLRDPEADRSEPTPPAHQHKPPQVATGHTESRLSPARGPLTTA
jgi:diguanylate cyclase (GGDEF)-like protein